MNSICKNKKKDELDLRLQTFLVSNSSLLSRCVPKVLFMASCIIIKTFGVASNIALKRLWVKC